MAIVTAVTLAIGGVLAGCASSATGPGETLSVAKGQSAGGADSDAAAPWLDRVFVIMIENHGAGQTIGDVNQATGELSMPFLTGLARTYGRATNYYGVTHPSQPNYIAATSGGTWGGENKRDWGWASGSRFDRRNIVDELEAAGIGWAAYMQAMPTPGYTGDRWPTAGSPLYVSKHDPFVLYTNIHTNPERMRNIKPYTQLAGDLASGDAPRYVWITPDLCSDMHLGVTDQIPGFEDSTPCPSAEQEGDADAENAKKVADDFLHRAVTTIMESKAWQGNSVIFITADENDDRTDRSKDAYGGGLIPMVVVTTNGPRRATDDTRYDHYSMLLTIEEGFGLAKLGKTQNSDIKPMWPLISNAG